MFSNNFILSTVIYLFAGAIFGAGLAISGMTDTSIVKGFLDITGEWNYSLMFVMATAIVITSLGYRYLFSKEKPLLESVFNLPKRSEIDKPLITGAIIFGIGWGLYGFCPGPALASLASLSPYSFAFVFSMAAGMFIAKKQNFF